jgi:transcriptional/translational regulatory protein YebC/TACO1
MTDNKARTAAKIRKIVSSAGGTFSRILYQFVKVGQLLVSRDGKTFDEITEQAIDLGAQDVEDEEDGNVKVLSAFTPLPRQIERFSY